MYTGLLIPLSLGLAQVRFVHSEMQDLYELECFVPEVHTLDYSQVELEILSVYHVSMFPEKDVKKSCN